MKSLLDRFRRKEDAEPRLQPQGSTSRADKAASEPKPEVELSSAPEQKVDELSLELGDFLHRIPPRFLQPGQHDSQLPIRIGLDEIANRIARGETTIPLSLVHQRVPQVFKSEVNGTETVEIRFPWQKLLKLIEETAGNASKDAGAAAETLALQLRKQPIRKPASGNTAAAKEAKANVPSTPPVEAPRAKGPLRNKEVSWFSRSAPVTSGDGQSENQKPAISSPVTTNAGESVVSKTTESAKPNTPTTTAPKVPELSPQPTGDDSQLSREEIIKARDSALAQLARIRGEYERQITVLGQEKQQIAEHRDRAVADLNRVRHELEDRLDQLEFEKSVAAKASERAAQKDKDRGETLQQELEQAQRELDELRSLFTEQTLSPESPTAGTSQANSGDNERVKREYQRTINELKRRVAQLENEQEERVQEFTKEKEFRLKAERQLVTAERNLKESADQLEAIRAEANQKLETELRKHEAEFEQLLVDQQKAFDQLQNELRKVQVERDDALAALEQTPTVPAAVEAWEARALAQLEADLDEYRDRMRSLIQKRHLIEREKELLASQVSHRAPAHDQQSPALVEEIARLMEQNAELAEEKAKALRQIEVLQNWHARGPQEAETIQR